MNLQGVDNNMVNFLIDFEQFKDNLIASYKQSFEYRSAVENFLRNRSQSASSPVRESRGRSPVRSPSPVRSAPRNLRDTTYRRSPSRSPVRQERSRSVGRSTYNTFSPDLGPESYTADNLERFILAYGSNAYDQYQDLLSNLKRQLMDTYVTSQGENPYRYEIINTSALTGNALSEFNDWKRRINQLQMEVARTGDYRRQLQQLRWDTVNQLYNQYGLVDLSQSPTSESELFDDDFFV